MKINGVLVRFTNTIKTRDTYNKKKAEKAKGDKRDDLPTTSRK